MNVIRFAVTALFVFFLGGAYAEDIFPNGRLGEEKQFSAIAAGTTMGGYPLYMGGRAWWLVKSKIDTNNLDVRIGQLHVFSPIEGQYFAEMFVTTSLGGGSESGYYSADMCNLGTPHLFMLNKAAGQDDNCLVIDPYVMKIGGADKTVLLVRVRSSQSNWRLYDVSLSLSLDKLGFPESTKADWTEAALSIEPKKKEFVANVVNWAKQLQDGVNSALAYSKPQGVFDAVPALYTLRVSE
jgi:hypothetical protein